MLTTLAPTKSWVGPSVVVAVLVFVSTMLAFGWIGFLASDDWAYFSGAQGWLNDFPYVARTHRTLRLPVVLPIALSVGVLGSGEFQTVLPTILYFLGLLGLASWSARVHSGDNIVAVLVVGLLASTPLFSVWATIVSADICELFFVLLSLWLFYSASVGKQPVLPLFLAGCAAGFAWLTRETSVALLILYALLFLRGAYLERRLYWVMAGGWLLIAGIEAFYYLAMTDDIFYKYRTILMTQPSLQNVFTMTAGAGTGNITNNRIVGPFAALLVNQEFGLLYYLAVPAVWMCCFSEELDLEQRRLPRLLFGLGVIWFFVVGYTLGLRALPRYFAVPTFVAVFLVSIWLRQILRHRSRSTALLLGMALLSTNLIAIYVENRMPLFGERALVRYVADTDELVYTNPHTAALAKQLLIWRGPGLVKRVRSEPPPPQSLYLYYGKGASMGSIHGKSFESALYRVGEDWIEVWRAEATKKFTGVLTQAFGLDEWLPSGISTRLIEPNPPAIVYRTSSATISLETN